MNYSKGTIIRTTQQLRLTSLTDNEGLLLPALNPSQFGTHASAIALSCAPYHLSTESPVAFDIS